MKNSGQVSLEYMTMLGLSLIIFAAVLYVATYMTSTSSMQMEIDTAYRAVLDMKTSADFIYVHGFPSRIQSNVRIPRNVEEISLEGNVVRIRMSVGGSFTDIYAVSKANMTGTDAIEEICQASDPADQLCGEGYYPLVFTAGDPDDPLAPDVLITHII